MEILEVMRDDWSFWGKQSPQKTHCIPVAASAYATAGLGLGDEGGGPEAKYAPISTTWGLGWDLGEGVVQRKVCSSVC